MSAQTRYNLRPRRTTPQQAQKDLWAKRLDGRWHIARRNRSSRGMRRCGNGCYQLSSLQSLFHLPKFITLMRKHNTPRRGVIENPCAAQQITVERAGRPKHKQIVTVLKFCIGCAMRNLINYYWGDINMGPDGLPRPIRTRARIIRPIQKLARARFGQGQQDPAEFLDFLLNELRESTQVTNNEWHIMFDAIFQVEIQEADLTNCGQPRGAPHNQTQYMFPAVPVFDNQPDSVDNAIARLMQPAVFQGITAPCAAQAPAVCTVCGPGPTSFTRTERIEAAPEYLRIQLQLGSINNLGQIVKIMNPIGIPAQLNLTAYQTNTTTPLLYQLASVLPHSGRRLNSGHWIATVKGPPGEEVFVINDSVVQARPLADLQNNPQTWVYDADGYPSDESRHDSESQPSAPSVESLHREVSDQESSDEESSDEESSDEDSSDEDSSDEDSSDEDSSDEESSDEESSDEESSDEESSDEDSTMGGTEEEEKKNGAALFQAVHLIYIRKR